MTTTTAVPDTDSTRKREQAPSWTFEPGHTEAGFRARHMMVTWVHGLFKDIHGELHFDLEDPLSATFSGKIDAGKLWTGEPDRDTHLRGADFFDVEQHPEITFAGAMTERTGDTHYKAQAELTIRGITRPVQLDVAYLGQWRTSFWVGEENRGTLSRIGYEAVTRINRHDFGVAWQDQIPGGGLVVSNEIEITLDIEAILDADLEATGAIDYYRSTAPAHHPDNEETPHDQPADTRPAPRSPAHPPERRIGADRLPGRADQLDPGRP
jgi:polyisoprenoid-binding protein YceI